jgi:hypothetical protein
MSLTKLSLGVNYDVIYKLFLPKESLVSDIPAWDGNIEKLFLQSITLQYIVKNNFQWIVVISFGNIIHLFTAPVLDKLSSEAPPRSRFPRLFPPVLVPFFPPFLLLPFFLKKRDS